MLISLPKTGSLLGLTLLFFSPLFSQIELPPFFSDHMVLQRDRPIRIWGRAAAGQQLRLSLENRITVVKANEEGFWMATMGSVAVGGPYELEIRAAAEVKKLTDVWVGEVWLCMGQSNMEWPLSKTADSEVALASADLPLLRYFKVPARMAMQPRQELPGGHWQISTRESAARFSGVAFHFAKSKIADESMPIGIIEATWGATAIQTWMGPEALQAQDGMAAILSDMEALNLNLLQDSLQKAEKEWRESFDLYDEGLAESWEDAAASEMGWPQMDLPQAWEQGAALLVDGVVWFKKDFSLQESQSASTIDLSLGILDDQEEVFINGNKLIAEHQDFRSIRHYSLPDSLLQPGENTLSVRISDFGYMGGFVGHPDDLFLHQGDWLLSLAVPWHYRWSTPDLPPKPRPIEPNSYPGLLYNAMIHPLTDLTIAGILWYQGESDLSSPYHYRHSLLSLIDDYRARWKLGDFPFLIAQLPYFRPPLSQPAESGWATLRESQAYPLPRHQIGLVPLIDQGAENNIHPREKAIVGKRFAQVESLLREKAPLSFGGARVHRIEMADSSLLLHFSDVGEGLNSLTPEHLPGFSIAGEDGVFHWAEAILTSPSSIRVASSSVAHPKYVRYAWADNPGLLDLFDGWLLPVPPFRTDTLKVPWE